MGFFCEHGEEYGNGCDLCDSRDVNSFHTHLDVCLQCESQPFNLCLIGSQLLHAEVAKSTVKAT
jgi:hypothetical protein